MSDADRTIGTSSRSGKTRVSMTILVRSATPADLPSILQIEHLCPSAARWPESDYRKAIAQPERLVLLAQEQPGVLGFLIAHRATQEWELENIAVSPEARRRGIGRALMEALIEQARRGGATEIRQEIRASNQAAQALGQTAGFVQEGRRAQYYQEPAEDALLFKYLVARIEPGKPNEKGSS